MNEEPKPQRGGKRPGSGRPKGTVKTGSANPANKFQFVLPEDVSRWVDEQGGNAWLKAQALKAFEHREHTR